MTLSDDLKLENIQAQMRKGVLEYCILLVISGGPAYASDLLSALKTNNLLVVEGTVYPILSRLKRAEYVEYTWVESSAGPPRKYYSLTEQGRNVLQQMTQSWVSFITSVNALRESYEKNA